MVGEEQDMRSFLCVVLVFLAACPTEPNPASCADGSCSDPSLPFCDVDATFQELEGLCIAVDCEPQQPAACRGDVLLRCNDAGNNYDLVQCELGCDPVSGCLGCSENTQCNNPAPICDSSTHECRACSDDDECTSRVCNAGSCAVQATVVYGSPNGTGQECSLAVPCSATTAIQRAATSTPPQTVRLLPGVYNEELVANTPSTTPVDIVAKGATITVLNTQTALAATNGAKLSLRDGSLTGRLFCAASAPAPRGLFRLRNVTLNDTGGWGGLNCDFEIERAEVAQSTSIQLGPDFAVKIDRMRFVGPINGGTINLVGDRSTLRITNSVLENVVPQFACATNCARTVEFAFNTFVLDQTMAVTLYDCTNPNGGTWTALWENNVLASFGPPPPLGNVLRTNATSSPSCTIRNNLLFPQPTPIANNTVGDPLFANQPGKDYHLMPASPAKDTAVPGTITTDHDFEGRARPQGPAPDRGAFELAQ